MPSRLHTNVAAETRVARPGRSATPALRGMNIIDGLLGEHAALYTVLDHIQRSAPGWDLAQLKEAGTLLRSVMLTHATLEDELLFDTLTTDSESLTNILAAMRQEHAEMGAKLNAIAEAETVREARHILNHLIEGVHDHFAVEERVLFRIAEQNLGRISLRHLGAEWARRRQLKLVSEV